MSNFKTAMNQENPLQIVGVINAYCAMLAEKTGFNAIYLSGAGVSNGLGLPDLSLITFSEMADEIRKIKARVNLPLLVDADTGFGSPLTIHRMVNSYQQAGANALHIEDQQFPKRCGHVKGIQLVDKNIMGDRIKACLDARWDENFLIMARTDAIQHEGLESAIERAHYYQDVGADIIFVEAANALSDYENFHKALTIPILSNMTEFGKTPLFTLPELKKVGVTLVLYPLSAFRAMNQAAMNTFQIIRKEGNSASELNKMQTRQELYQILDYEFYESLEKSSWEKP